MAFKIRKHLTGKTLRGKLRLISSDLMKALRMVQYLQETLKNERELRLSSLVTPASLEEIKKLTTQAAGLAQITK